MPPQKNVLQPRSLRSQREQRPSLQKLDGPSWRAHLRAVARQQASSTHSRRRQSLQTLVTRLVRKHRRNGAGALSPRCSASRRVREEVLDRLRREALEVLARGDAFLISVALSRNNVDQLRGRTGRCRFVSDSPGRSHRLCSKTLSAACQHWRNRVIIFSRASTRDRKWLPSRTSNYTRRLNKRFWSFRAASGSQACEGCFCKRAPSGQASLPPAATRACLRADPAQHALLERERRRCVAPVSLHSRTCETAAQSCTGGIGSPRGIAFREGREFDTLQSKLTLVNDALRTGYSGSLCRHTSKAHATW